MSAEGSNDMPAAPAAGEGVPGPSSPPEFRSADTPDLSASPGSAGTPPVEEVRGIPDERGIPSVNRVRSVQARVTALLAMGLTSLTGLGLLGWYYHRALTRPASSRPPLHAALNARAQTDAPLPPLGLIHPPRRVPDTTAQGHPPGVDPMQALLGPAPPPPPATLLTPSPEGAMPPGAPSAPSAGRGGTHPPSGRERNLDRRLDGAVSSSASASSVAGEGGNIAAGGMSAPPSAANVNTGGGPTEVSMGAPAASPHGPPAGGLATLLTPDVTAAVTARVLPTQRFLIPKGAFIDCTLETAIDSTLPGMTTCVTATDTFGADGRVVLLERGTKLVGETRGQVEQGQARVFVLWTEARTPAGVIVPLASPSTDELGRSGLSGEVDRHFFQRFGAALLISLIDIGVQEATQPTNGGTVILNPTASEEVLTEVLRGTINIPPTVRVAQGARIQVLVARDLDFRRVYELKMPQAHAAVGTPAPPP